MQRSEQINELATALAKAQGMMRNAELDRVNPFFKSKYATLASVWDAIRVPLSENGLSIAQAVTQESERMYLETVMMHTSGQYIISQYPILPAKNDPQGIGVALTYARRYSLAPMVGITADEDDDGNGANSKQQSQQPTQAHRQQPAPAPQPAPVTPPMVIAQTIRSQQQRDEVAEIAEAYAKNGNGHAPEPSADEMFDQMQSAHEERAAAEHHNPATMAVLDGAVAGKFRKWCEKFTEVYPAYRKNGQPDMFHILKAAKAEQFDKITTENVNAVCDALKARAEAKVAGAVAGK